MPSSFSIIDAGAFAEAAGLHVLVREERNDWLEQQQAFYQQAVAADSDTAEPALHMLADEGRAMLPYLAFARRRAKRGGKDGHETRAQLGGSTGTTRGRVRHLSEFAEYRNRIGVLLLLPKTSMPATAICPRVEEGGSAVVPTASAGNCAAGGWYGGGGSWSARRTGLGQGEI